MKTTNILLTGLIIAMPSLSPAAGFLCTAQCGSNIQSDTFRLELVQSTGSTRDEAFKKIEENCHQQNNTCGGGEVGECKLYSGVAQAAHGAELLPTSASKACVELP